MAIDLTRRGFGFAVLEGPTTLIDWGVKAVRTHESAKTLTKVAQLIQHYCPDTIVTENHAGKGSRRCHRIKILIDAVSELAAEQGVTTRQFSPAQIKVAFAAFGATTKYQIAHAIALQLPELASHLPRYRKPWMPEDYRMTMFCAASMALTLCWVAGSARHPHLRSRH